MEYEVLQSFKGSPDGYTVIEYEKGKNVDLPDELAAVAIRNKWVKKPEGKKTPSEEKKAKMSVVGKEIGALKKALKDAADPDKPTVQAALDAKVAELEALKAQ